MSRFIQLGFILSFIITSCKSDLTKEASQPSSTAPNINQTAQLDPNIKSTTPDSKLVIPDPCALISNEDIKRIFKMNIDPSSNVGSDGVNSEKSCFYRVQDSKPNGAILIQVATNPVPGEIDDYPVMIILGKTSQGEQDPQTGRVEKYLPLPELGDMGCYNYSMARYNWQYNKDYLFMLAFNTSHNEKDQKALAIEIAKIINSNFLSKINKQ